MIKANEDYFKVHAWLIYHFGKADKCSCLTCVCKNSKRFEWAHIKGMPMTKDRSNFTQLCPSCHRKYDYTDAQRQKQSLIRQRKSIHGTLYTEQYKRNLSNAMKGVNAIRVQKLSVNNEVIEEYESVSIAANKNNILQTSISNVLTSRAKTAGGFIWAYKQMN